MGRGKRPYMYKPRADGWVVVQDMHRNVLWFADCNSGNAQMELQRKFDQLIAEGWKAEGRKFDFQFFNRGKDRVEVDISPTDPTKPLPHNMVRMPGRSE